MPILRRASIAPQAAVITTLHTSTHKHTTHPPQYDLAFIETSALDSTGVEVAFNRILSEIYRVNQARRALKEEGGATVKPGDVIVMTPEGAATPKAKSRCC